MKRVFHLSFFLLASLAVNAQDSAGVRKPHYFLTYTSGMMLGREQLDATTVGFTTSLVQGVVLGRFRAGAGIGYDSYTKWHTMPVYGQVSYDILGKGNALYLQVGYGYAWAWRKPELYEPSAYSYEGGRSFTAALGYRVAVSEVRLHFTLGYKFQSATTVSTYYPYQYLADAGFAPTSSTSIREDLNRVVFSIGIGLW